MAFLVFCMLEPVTPEQLPKAFQTALGKTKSVEIGQTEQPLGDLAQSVEELACHSILEVYIVLKHHHRKWLL